MPIGLSPPSALPVFRGGGGASSCPTECCGMGTSCWLIHALQRHPAHLCSPMTLQPQMEGVMGDQNPVTWYRNGVYSPVFLHFLEWSGSVLVPVHRN